MTAGGIDGTEPNESWREYELTRSPAVRDRLILHYSPLVKYVVGRMSSGLPAHVDRGDLISYGILGLIDAIDRFESHRGNKFETYAIRRIRGAVLDALRNADWAPRSVRTKARHVDRTCTTLENSLGRAPSEEELARASGLTLRELVKLRVGLSGRVAVNLDQETRSGRLLDTLVDVNEPGPVEIVESREMRRLLIDALHLLPQRARLLMTLYYFEGLSLQQIGDVFGVTESRVCQLHARAIRALHTRLSKVTSGETTGPVRALAATPR